MDAFQTPYQAGAELGPLRGVRVLEVGQWVAGPITGMLLADQGATVIKVERPTGDPARTMDAFATWNRGKDSVVLDLRTPGGRAAAAALIAHSDVVIENFADGAADRLGVGWDAASRVNPRVVHCSLPPFAPELGWPAELGWDPLIMAMTGFETELSYSDGQPTGEDRPLHTPLPIASCMAAVQAAGAIVAGLLVAERDGAGQHIEVPLHNAVASAMSVFHTRLNSKYHHPYYRFPIATRARCRDGHYVQLQGGLSHFIRDLLVVLGREEWVGEALSDWRHGTDQEGLERWKLRLDEVFAQRDAHEWEEALSDAGLICTRLRSVEEWLESEHARSAGLVIEVDDPRRGRMLQPGLAVTVGARPHFHPAGAPFLGRDTGRILAAAARPEHVRPEREGAPTSPAPDTPRLPLDGIRVLDLCVVLAGPTCGRTLAEFGADVIKIDDPTRDDVGDWRRLIDTDRGKRSMVLNLRESAARDTLWQLIATADVLLENYRTGALDRLGFGYQDVARRHPRLVYASVSCYGVGGPLTGRPGYEQNAQAVTGAQIRRSGRQDRSGRLITYPVNDYATGMLGAFGIMAALRERARSGTGQRVHASLVQAAGVMQSRFMFDYPGYVRTEPEGLRLLGESPLSQLYETADGDWVYVHLRGQVEWERFVRMAPFRQLGADPRFGSEDGRHRHGGALGRELANRIGACRRAELLDAARAARVAMAARVSFPDFSDDLRRCGVLVCTDVPGVGTAEHIGAATARLTLTPKRGGAICGRLGQHGDEILAELNGELRGRASS